MMMMRTSCALLAVAASTACGGGGGGPDAFVIGDAGPEVDGLAGDCVDEADDDGNDTDGEPTGSIAGIGDPVRICGRIAEREPGPGDLVDIDMYRIEAGDAERLLIRLVADGGLLEQVAVEVYASEDAVVDGEDRYLGGASVLGTHGVFVADADPAGYVVVVVGINGVRPTSALDYELRIVADDPLARCPDAEQADYVEQLDSEAGNVENDVVQLKDGYPLTGSPLDTPEPSGPELTIAPDGVHGVDGEIGVHVLPVDESYLDRDTYVVATGANTNQLDVRVRWTDGKKPSDLDWYLFDDRGEEPPILIRRSSSTENPELQTAAVLPSSTYWLVVGSYAGSAPTQPYQITVCGTEYSP
jgi:hypothetical protein